MNEKYLYWEDERMKVDLRSLFYDILKSGPLYYSDLQKNAMELILSDNGKVMHIIWLNPITGAKMDEFYEKVQ